MTASEDTLDLCDAGRNGGYLLDPEDIEALMAATDASGLRLLRVDLAESAGKAALLGCIAHALKFPDGFGHNWDALGDSLRDLEWLPAAGYVLLFEHADVLRNGAEDDFAILLDILDDAAGAWAQRGSPFFAFLALSEQADAGSGTATDDGSDPVGPRQPGSQPAIDFVLEGDHVELNQLLKLVGLCDSGGAGKAIVASGAVSVDGVPELRKTCKIRAGQRVVVGGIHIEIRGA